MSTKYLQVTVVKEEVRPGLDEGSEVKHCLVEGSPGFNYRGWVDEEALIDAPESSSDDKLAQAEKEIEDLTAKLQEAETDRDTAKTELGEANDRLKELQNVDQAQGTADEVKF